jgi:hydroxypyruvate isomerase
MAHFAANLSFLFSDLPFLDRFEAASRAGFKGVEFMFPYAHPIEDIRTRLDANGLDLVLFNLPPGHWDRGERGFAALPGRENEFAARVELALQYAETLGVKRLHAMAGLTSHGADRDTYLSNLKLAAQWAAPLGIDILIEPINTRDMPDYFLSRTAEARAVITDVAEPNLGLQLDLYHRHVMEGGAAEAIEKFKDITRHYQCAQPPDRGEPDVGELDYRDLFRRIDATGYSGWIGCEYKPRGDTVDGLAWAHRLGVSLG